MLYYIIKTLVSALLIVAISEVAKRNSLLGATLASIPLVSVLAMIWLFIDTGDVSKVSSLSIQIFWLVIPSLVLFIALPLLIKMSVPFFYALAASILLTSLSYLLTLSILKHLRINI